MTRALKYFAILRDKVLQRDDVDDNYIKVAGSYLHKAMQERENGSFKGKEVYRKERKSLVDMLVDLDPYDMQIQFLQVDLLFLNNEFVKARDVFEECLNGGRNVSYELYDVDEREFYALGREIYENMGDRDAVEQINRKLDRIRQK